VAASARTGHDEPDEPCSDALDCRAVTTVDARANATIIASPERVYDAIVRADVVTTFFPDRASGDLTEGSEVTWAFDHADAEVTIRATSLDRPERIVFRWDAAGVGFKTVTFTLEKLDDGRATKISVTETPFPLDSIGVTRAVQQTRGWSEFLCYLKARVQFDIELRTGRTC
jgi:uncharacterized protein YndB with AHSA1/START domain